MIFNRLLKSVADSNSTSPFQQTSRLIREAEVKFEDLVFLAMKEKSIRVQTPHRWSTQMRTSQALVVVVLDFLFFVDFTFAQQVTTEPASTHIFPAGGRRGTRVDVRVGGECLPPKTRFRMFGDGITAPTELGDRTTGQYAASPRRKPGEQQITYPKEWQSQLKIAADAPLGVKLWRLSCARGGTGARPFIVGDLPEFIETEPNSLPAEAERVEMPTTVNGQIAGESDLDYFRFDAKAGEVVRVDVAAARLGSALDPIVQVIGPDGHRVAADDVRIGADPVLAFRATVSGEYRLLISNVTFRGGPSFVYRVTLSTAPLVRYAFPSGGQGGTTSEINFFALTGEGPPRILRESVTFPATVSEFFSPPGPAGTNSLPFAVGDLSESLEIEGNDSRESATELVWPAVMNGQFETTNDEDWFRLTCRKDVSLTIECSPQPRWSPSLPIVAVTDANGGVLASASAVQTVRGTTRIEWRAPADGTYWLRLRDLQQGIRGGPEFIYRLTVCEAVPDFALSLKADVINVVQGGRVDVDVAVDRRGGFAGSVELIVDGLPEGVRIEGQQVAANQPTAKLAFIADAEARSCDVILKIKGKVEINGKTIERQAQVTHLAHDVDGVGLGSSEVDHVQLTVVHKPVFKLYCNEAYQYAHRGTIYPYLMEVERLDGFNGPIHLQVADRQIKCLDGIEIPEITVAPTQSQFMLPLNLPETMHINVQAHSNVYAQGHVEFLDKFGQTQTLLVVSTMRCMIRTLPTVVKLRSVLRELTAPPGSTITCSLALDRTSHFSGSMQIQLIDPPAGITAIPASIAAGESHAEISVQIDSSLKLPQILKLKFRAIGAMDGDTQVVSETALSLKIESRP